MNALGFLLRKKMINFVRDILHHPSRLVLYIVVIGVILLSALSGGTEEIETSTQLPFAFLQGGLIGIFTLIFSITIYSSLQAGTTFFEMADVSFLFGAPISPKKILGYGLVKQAATSVLVLVFLICYMPMLRDSFGVDTSFCIGMVLCFALVLFAAQLLGMFLYGFVNGSRRRIQVVKGIWVATLVLEVVLVPFLMCLYGGHTEALTQAVGAPWLTWYPIAGWSAGLLCAAWQGNWLMVVLYGALLAATIFLVVWFFMHRDVDYYEDVLQATEITYRARVAMKKGGMNANVRTDMVNSARKSRVRGIGLHRGQGASAFFFKSWRESMRQSRIPFLRASTFVILLGSAVTLGITMMVSADDGPLSPNIMLFICLVFSVYMQFFFGAAGSWSREIAKPTIYLVPERPFMKLVWACMDSFLQPAFDGIILFVVMGLMCQGPVSTVLTCMGLFFSYGVLFTAGNVLSQRVMGSFSKQGLFMIIMLLMVLLLALPGGLVGLILLFAASCPLWVAGVACMVLNLFVSVGVLALCRNLLEVVEYTA